MKNSEKIGVGVITCNRPDYLRKLIHSLIPCESTINNLVVVNDGNAITDYDLPFGEWIDNPQNLGVAKSKNIAMKYLLDMGCDHIFIIEDDMLIKDSQIFSHYINASKQSGIQHLMFGYHGPANKNGISKGKPYPRLIVNYGEFSLAFNQHCVGAFCYYSRKSLEDVGLIDEEFRNAFDHVSHSYELALKGYSTPYWWWADLANSLEYIEEQACSEENSSIKTPETIKQWESNIRNSMCYFNGKYGYYPFGKDGVPDSNESEILKILKNKKHK